MEIFTSSPTEDAVVVLANTLRSYDSCKSFHLHRTLIILDEVEKKGLPSLMIDSLSDNVERGLLFAVFFIIWDS